METVVIKVTFKGYFFIFDSRDPVSKKSNVIADT